MATSVSKVRQELADLQSQSISDAIIQQQIDLALQYVNDVKISDANADSLDYATLTLAAYFTYDLFTSSVSRTLGATPTLSMAKSERLMRKAEMYINMISKDRVSLREQLFSPAVPQGAMVPTLLEDIVVDEQSRLS